jgi:hypothetical protein
LGSSQPPGDSRFAAVVASVISALNVFLVVQTFAG